MIQRRNLRDRTFRDLMKLLDIAVDIVNFENLPGRPKWNLFPWELSGIFSIANLLVIGKQLLSCKTFYQKIPFIV